MNRFSDNLDLVSPQDYQPASIQDLMLHLHLENSPRVEQESAIRSWLNEHPPGRLMVLTLKRNGFGHLLERRSTA